MRIFKYIALTLVALLVIFFSIGLFNPAITYSNQITIHASPAKTFKLFADTSRLHEWMTGFSSFTKISGKDDSAGSKWKLVLIQEGQTYDMTETILKNNSPDEYSFLLENAVLTNNVDMHFKPSSAGTELTVNNKVRGNNLMWRSLFYFFESRLKQESDEMYDDLKTMVETSVE